MFLKKSDVIAVSKGNVVIIIPMLPLISTIKLKGTIRKILEESYWIIYISVGVGYLS